MPFDATDYREVRLLDRDPKTLTDPRERLEYLRDFLRERVSPGMFDMEHPGSWEDAETGSCGTPACIAGHARALFRIPGNLHDISRALAVTQINSRGLNALFYPNDMSDGSSGYDATPTQAANVLDHLLKTGEVDWSVA